MNGDNGVDKHKEAICGKEKIENLGKKRRK
jgi:hypothetical protein